MNGEELRRLKLEVKEIKDKQILIIAILRRIVALLPNQEVRDRVREWLSR